jgi:hypothetical protein
MRLIVSPSAAKDLAALPARDQRALFFRVEAFAADPFAGIPQLGRCAAMSIGFACGTATGARSAGSTAPPRR